MKTRTRLLSLILALSMIFSLAACGSSSDDSEEEEDEATEAVEEETEDEEETAEEDTEEESDSVEGALEGVSLVVGTTGLFGPFTYYDDDGTTLIGYDLDLIAALQEYLGFEIDGEIQALTYSALTTSIGEGMIDIGLAALCATDERKEIMDFSDIYLDSGQILCINSETTPDTLTSVEDLLSGDYVVAVESGTASHLYAVNAGIPDECIEVHDSITTAYESLEQGKVDCLIQDQPGMAFYINTAEETNLEMIGEEFNQGQSPYCIAVSFNCEEENEGILEIFNAALEYFTEIGYMDELYEKWCA